MPSPDAFDYENPGSSRCQRHLAFQHPARCMQRNCTETSAWEGPGADVDVRDISDAHVPVKTMNGSVNSRQHQDAHGRGLTRWSGEVTLNGVKWLIGTSGFDQRRDPLHWRLRQQRRIPADSHSGDIDATIPEWTSADVSARSVRGEVHDDNSPPAQDPHLLSAR